MKIIAGVDIGNSTTEVCIGAMGLGEPIKFLSQASVKTTGMKGTIQNVAGIVEALQLAVGKIHRDIKDISIIRLNEAAPVIGDTAMETITETIITESSMIGHNPSTPSGIGHAVGYTLSLDNIGKASSDRPYLVMISKAYSYEKAASILNQYQDKLSIQGIMMQADEAVLVQNRLSFSVPIVDEIRFLLGVPEGKLAAIEVAYPGESIRMLSNPYGIATLLELTPEETASITPIAKSLIGKRSAVVIKTPAGNVKEQVLPAGSLNIQGNQNINISIDSGAEKIMEALEACGEVKEITGERGTNIGKMFDKIKDSMKRVSDSNREVSISDILAVDTMAPVHISGALAGEKCLEKAVGIAAMVKTNHLPMGEIANKLQSELGIFVEVAGVEAVMATLGALTTPGTQVPLAILDMGGGSTDAAIITAQHQINTTHQSGAGELVSMLIQTELGLSHRSMAEEVKKYPAAKVESVFHIRMENGSIKFYDEPLDPRLFGHVVLLTPEGLIKVEGEDISLEKVVQVRREVKKKVFLTNALRALKKVAPEHNLKNISNIVLVGGSALDFEIPEMLMEVFAPFKIVCGRGNIQGKLGARNAVATGLVLSYIR